MIDARRLTGPGAGVAKYDILTAIGLIGMRPCGLGDVPILRLIAAVTARYNWRSDEMVIGQKELARIWGVAERTAKREVKRLTSARILLVKRAGVRGRVASYSLNMAEIARLSRPHWEEVGLDFAERMAVHEPIDTKVVRVNFAAVGPEEPEGQGGTWGSVRGRLRADDPVAFANWYDQLTYLGQEEGEVHLKAATPFVARYVETHLAGPLAAAIKAELGPSVRLRIECGQ